MLLLTGASLPGQPVAVHDRVRGRRPIPGGDTMDAINSDPITRRRALRDLGAAGLAASGLEALLGAAAQAAPRHGTLADIDHVVILMQENRSFDHYFGTYSRSEER